jgi:two-component system CheB/CheR fusion protein
MRRRSRSKRSGSAPSRAGLRLPDPAVLKSPHADRPPEPSETTTFPIVGIGASAGGLEAFTQLLRALPHDTGMAFVFIQHLAPTRETILTDLLSRATRMPTSQVEDSTRVQPNHVYVIPPNHSMTIAGGVLHLGPRDTAPGGRHLPIDVFFASLADDQGARAIGVILSGTGADGAVGLRAIKTAGGVTFAQDERSAQHDGMPRSAVVAGAVDIVLPPSGIGAELARIARHPYVESSAFVKGEGPPADAEDGLSQIFAVLRSETGTDFQHYKTATVRRRVARRMLLHRIETLDRYAGHLRQHPAEVHALHADLFVTVTRFFRDPESFSALTQTALPGIMKDRPRGTPIRVWTPGCATGEEAYSILMVLKEFLDDANVGDVPIQMFATDANETSIERARVGLYPESIALDVSAERLRRFFIKVDGQYQVRKSLRDLVVFAKHDIVTDPPFSKLDLLTCRNVLIYLGPVLQRRVLPVFHYALNPMGVLLLGSAETPAAVSDLFVPVDTKHKIYARRPGLSRGALGWTMRDHAPDRAKGTTTAAAEPVHAGREPELDREADRVLLAKYAPAGVIVNENLEVLHVRGRVSPYLEVPAGAVSFSLLKMLREGLLVDVRAAIKRVRTTGAPIRKNSVQVRRDGDLVRVNVAVIPLHASTPRGAATAPLLVLFEDSVSDRSASRKERHPDRSKRSSEEGATAALKAELASTKDYLQAIINEREAVNEELTTSSEELQSANEELQSTNEELEASKEELQSLNEELTTVNDELQARNAELGRLNSDLTNVLSSVTIPIVIVGPDLRIRRFTGMAERVLNLVASDIGRSILTIRPKINVTELESVLLGVIETLTPWEQDVQDQDGHWYSVRVLPYRSIDNKIDGAVVAFIGIDDRRRLEAEVQSRSDELERVNKIKDDFLAVLSHELRTPLTAMLGWTRMLRAGHLDPTRTVHAVDVIERNVVWQGRLIEDLLDVSRIVVGKMRLDLRPLSLRVVVEAAVDTLRPAANAKGVRLESALGSDPAVVVGDSVRLQQTLGNLLTNALKFTPAGGRIEVRLGRVDTGVQLEVQDTGQGIAPELLPHLFERFRQAEVSLTRSKGGLGLGLAIAKHLVEQHSGSIRAESPGVGQGATFVVRLPAAPAGTEIAPADQEPQRVSGYPSLAGIRVLVVEDHDDAREFIAVALEGCDAAVTTATSVENALAAFERVSPDVVVSDLGLPGDDGYAFIRRLRELPPERGGRVRTVALTAYARPEDRDAALAAGYDRHLAKPIDPLDLAVAVAELAQRR